MSRTPLAELVVPALRWDRERGFGHLEAEIERFLDMGVGGFIIFGGESGAVRRLTRDLQAGSRHPLLIASDMERGAGQQVRGAASLPPPAALSALGEEAVRAAALLTAREARDLGINWVLAPVADLDTEPANPIVQTRSFGEDPAAVAWLVKAWVEACQAEGVLACAKHFPGHGRTRVDSHATLPVVECDEATLHADLAPFEVAVASGVASVMSAHVAYPALDPSGAPATLSPAILTGLLRDRLGFNGLVVTDALIMEGVGTPESESSNVVRAILAGCDLLLYPRDPAAVVDALRRVSSDSRLERLLDRSRERRDAALRRAASPRALGEEERGGGSAEAEALCERTIILQRGTMSPLGREVEIAIVDDDAGGPYELPSRRAFEAELRRRLAGVQRGRETVRRIVLLFADVKSWKGRAGLADASREQLAALLPGSAAVVVFGHPRRAAEVPGDVPVVCAWSGDEAMQRAAARRLAALE